MSVDIEECGFRKSPCSGHPKPPVYDVVIIGAGAVGTSIARELSKYDVNVLLVEKANDVAQGASKANSGIIHGGYDDRAGSLKARLVRDGCHAFPVLNSQLNFGFRKSGSLVACMDKADEGRLHALYVNGVKNGVQVKIMSREEVMRLEPSISPDVVAALYCPDAGVVSPYEYCIALAENAVDNGVHIRLRTEVHGVERLTGSDDGARFVVQAMGPPDNAAGCEACPRRGNRADLPSGELAGVEIRSGMQNHRFRARAVINCAGLSSARIASLVGACDFKILPRRGEYLVLSKAEAKRLKLRHVVFPMPSAKGKGILVTPTYWGNVLVGPTSRDVNLGANPARMLESDVESAVKEKWDILEEITQGAKLICPEVDVSRAITSYMGWRTKTDRSDHDFIIEESPVIPGWFNVAGIDSPGLTSSPAIAVMVAALVGGSGIDLRPKDLFCPTRPAHHVAPENRPPHYELSTDHPEPTHRVICRCESVTEAEIVEAVTRPHLPALSTDAVKRRTRAGMGLCQGRYCEPRVADIIARETGMNLEDVPRRRGLHTSLLPERQLSDETRDRLSKL